VSKIAHDEPNNRRPSACELNKQCVGCFCWTVCVVLHSARFYDTEMAVTPRVIMCCLRLQGFGRKPLVRPRRRLEIDVKIDLKEIDWKGAWTGLI
jgi:hypothetical protein